MVFLKYCTWQMAINNLFLEVIYLQLNQICQLFVMESYKITKRLQEIIVEDYEQYFDILLWSILFKITYFIYPSMCNL